MWDTEKMRFAQEISITMMNLPLWTERAAIDHWDSSYP